MRRNLLQHAALESSDSSQTKEFEDTQFGALEKLEPHVSEKSPDHGHPAGHDHHDSYGHDRAPLHGVEVHDVEVDEVTLEQQLRPVEEQVETVEEAADLVAALEELGAIAAEAPLNEQAAKILNVATEQILGQLGFPASVKIVPTLEAFKEGEDTTSASKLALEAIGETAAKVWNAIIATLRKAALWLKDFLRRFIDYAGGMEKRIAAAREAHQQLSSRTAHSDAAESFREANLYNRLQMHGGFPQDVAAAAQSTEDVIELQLQRFQKSSLLNGDLVHELTQEHLARATYAAKEQVVLSGLKHGATQPGEEDKNGTRMRTDELLGGMVIEQKVGPAEATGADAFTWLLMTPSLMPADKRVDHSRIAEDEKHAVPAAKMEAVPAILDQAEKLFKHVVGFRPIQGKLERLVHELTTKAEEISKKWVSTDEKYGNLEQKTEASMQKAYIAAAPRMFVKEPAQVLGYMNTTATALVSYCEKSMALYKRDSVEPQAAKPAEGADKPTEGTAAPQQ